MSVILNALRARKGEKKDPPATPAGDGLFIGHGALEEKRQSKSVSVLLLTFSGVILIALAILWSRGAFLRDQLSKIPSSDSTIKAAPAFKPLSQIIDEARALYLQNSLDDSLALYKEALKDNPTNAQVHNDVGMVFLKKEMLTESETHLSKAIELDPTCAECFNNFGYLKTLLGDKAQAEKQLKIAATLNDKYPDPYFNLGVLYESNGDFGNAANAYQDFLRRLPDKNSPLFLQVEKNLHSLMVR